MLTFIEYKYRRMLRQHQKLITLFIFATSIFLLGKFVEINFDHEYTHKADTYSIQQTILDKQIFLDHELNKLSMFDFNNESNVWALMDSLSNPETHYYLIKDSMLIAWSTQSVSKIDFFNDTSSVVKLSNGWYLTQRIKTDSFTLVGLSLIKKQYKYENKFLSNTFSDDFETTHHPLITITQQTDEHVIKDANNNYLFSLKYEHHQIISPVDVLAFICYCITYCIFILLIIQLLELYKTRKCSNRVLIPVFLFIFGLSLFFNRFCIPDNFQYHILFSPLTFAVSDWLSSLANMLMYGLALIVFSFCYYRYYKTPQTLTKDVPKFKKYAYTCAILLFVMLLFLIVGNLIKLVVQNSSQASIFFNIEDLNIITLIQILGLSIFYIAIIFIFERTIVSIKDHISLFEFGLLSTLVFLILLGLNAVTSFSISCINLIIFLIIGGISYKATRNQHNGITYSTFIWIIFTISFYAIFLIYIHNIKKEENNRELIIENLSFQLTREADPVAEMYLADIEQRLTKDSVLIKLLIQNDNTETLIRDHLKKNYFYGYWKRYDFETVVCWNDANLFIETENLTTNCYTYFNDLIAQQGDSVNNCNYFYFMDNDNGQTTYFGRIPFLQDDISLETTLFCEINSTPVFSGLGYPELLKNEQEQIIPGHIKNYSFAKYIDNKLVKQFGTYRYPMNNQTFKCSINEKMLINDGEMRHMVYQVNEHVTIVLSRPKIKVIYLLMSFSTFSLIFFIIASLFLLITRSHKNKTALKFSIQERIQISFVSLMIIILLVMGISSVFYSIHQFKEKNNQMLSQRIKSVLQEMEQKIVNEPKLDEGMADYLQYLMQKFSNVFYSDINLYKLDGQLLATSRPELYQQGLTSHMMNTQAYYQLVHKQKTEFIHEESIGKLHYTSAYVPIFNYKHEVLAYLNLPYFVGNNELKSEISSLIVAVINAYLLFVLFAIGLAVVISRRITRPLIIIQDRLAQIRIDKLNKKIEYKGNDEIGSLVKEYNRMVDDISESAEKLAKSERESAWREMAKQIAHEIKNPLTPMKLSVQYLTKAWDSQRDDFDSFLKRVSNTLIEQIDQLHIIANEFSNFAKMPQAQRKKVDLIEKLVNTTSLFDKAEPNIHFKTQIGDTKHYIFADPDQLLSVFNNVIKNAVQAIPNDREGIINITTKVSGLNILISVSDNGRGISEEIRNKIFMPNFTTKSSGMGLGLAIVKNIVNNSGGKIWFETKENIGSTFYIQFPIYNGE